MRGIFAIPILLLLVTAVAAAASAAASRSGTGRMSRALETNNLLLAHQDQLVLGKRYYMRGSSGRPFHIKTKSRFQKGRKVRTKSSSSLSLNEAMKSLLDKIRQKMIEQAVLQALALDFGYNPGSNN